MHNLTLATLMAAVVSVASAGPIPITVTGDFEGAFAGTGGVFTGSGFKVNFVTEQFPTTLTPQPDGNAFTVDITATYQSGTFLATLPGTAGWFFYPPGVVGPAAYEGVDIRFPNAAGSPLQIVSVLSSPAYTGTANSPSLLIMDVPAQASTVVYYVTPQVNSNAAGGHYTAGLTSGVPEPGTAGLLAAALVAVLALRYSSRVQLRGQAGADGNFTDLPA
jgi:hypothetical protein